MLSLKGTFWVATVIGINLLIEWFKFVKGNKNVSWAVNMFGLCSIRSFWAFKFLKENKTERGPQFKKKDRQF